MNILKHYHACALEADRKGFPYFAAAVRALLVQEIEQASTADFWGFVLDLPHPVESVDQVVIDGTPVDLPAIECDRIGFLDTLPMCGCRTKEEAVRYGRARLFT